VNKRAVPHRMILICLVVQLVQGFALNPLMLFHFVIMKLLVMCVVKMKEQMSADKDRITSAVRQLWRDELSSCSTAQQPTDLSHAQQ